MNRTVPAFLLLLSALLAAGRADARRGPLFSSYRAQAMGNAWVAIADDKDALHLNPAGLAQIGRLGTPAWPDRQLYWGDKLEAQWNFLGIDAPLGAMGTLYRHIDRYEDYYRSGSIDTLLDHPEVFDDYWSLDREPIPVNINGSFDFAMRDYGASAWGDIEPVIQIDHGALTPKVGIGISATQVLELGMARPFLEGDRLLVGIGYRIASVRKEFQELDVMDLEHAEDTARTMGRDVLFETFDVGSWGHGLDLGAIWYQTPELRFGGALQNVGMKLDDRFVTPELTLGVAWSPYRLLRNDRWARRINFALDLEDLLDDDRNYKPLSKINFGAEWTQTLWPKVLVGTLATGFKGGYPSFGLSGDLLRVLHLEAVTYAEEVGYYTGQKADRYYRLVFGIGI